MISSPPVNAGDHYLVDLGQLVHVAAVNARSAFLIASTGCAAEPEHPLVYQIDPAGELIAVFD